MNGPVFRRDGDAFLPQPVSRAGWYDEVLHGGPVAALFAREVEQVPAAIETMVTRLTVDLMRPVPTKPLTIDARVVREGRRIQVIEGVMEADGIPVARASALRMRVADIEVPEHPRRDALPGPEGFDSYDAWQKDEGEEWFHSHAVESRFVEGDFYEPGPATVWMRLIVPLVDGEGPSRLQRVAAVSDFGNGISRVLGRGWLFINADLTVYLQKYPEDDWVCLRARTDIDSTGVGLAQSELFDRSGAIGHALQSLFVDRAPDSDGP